MLRQIDTSTLGPISTLGEDPRRCVAKGKEVLLDGVHFADAISEAAAAIIADGIQYAGLAAERIPPEARNRLESYLA